jgi:hypothetical protein
MQEPTRPGSREGRSGWNRTSEQIPSDLPGYWRRHAGKRGPDATREVPAVIAGRINWQLARGERVSVWPWVDLNGHEAGNGGHSQGTPIAYRPLFYSEKYPLNQALASSTTLDAKQNDEGGLK